MKYCLLPDCNTSVRLFAVWVFILNSLSAECYYLERNFISLPQEEKKKKYLFLCFSRNPIQVKILLVL